MAVKRISVHCIEIEDEPGSLHKLLAKAASANVDLHCFMAFSAGHGRGRVYVSGKDPAIVEACAQQAQIETTPMAGFTLVGEDKIGAAADALKGLAEAGINGVAAAAMVCDGQYHLAIVVKAEDADSAEKALGA